MLHHFCKVLLCKVGTPISVTHRNLYDIKISFIYDVQRQKMSPMALFTILHKRKHQSQSRTLGDRNSRDASRVLTKYIAFCDKKGSWWHCLLFITRGGIKVKVEGWGDVKAWIKVLNNAIGTNDGRTLNGSDGKALEATCE